MGRFVCGDGSTNEELPSAVELAGFTDEILRVRSTHRQPGARDALGSKGKTSQSSVSSHRTACFIRRAVLNSAVSATPLMHFHADADLTSSRQERLRRSSKITPRQLMNASAVSCDSFRNRFLIFL
jgi:hypothetical protein